MVKRDPNQRVPLATRIKGSIYNQLIESADDNDRPLGNEIELLIERAALIERLSTKGLRALMPAISTFAAAGEQFASEWGVEGDWTLDPESYKYALGFTVQRLVEGVPGPWDGPAVHAILEQAFTSGQHARDEAAKRGRGR
jgi:hypothetical protein